jgi:hypothetical protein
MKQTLQFLDQQLANRQGELQAAEQRRLTFETQHPELAQGGVSLIQRWNRTAPMRGLDADIAAAQARWPPSRPDRQHAQTVAVNGRTGGLRVNWPRFRPIWRGCARGLTENHPDVIAARNQIVSLRQQMKAEGNSGAVSGTPNPAYATLESIRAERKPICRVAGPPRRRRGEIAQRPRSSS